MRVEAEAEVVEEDVSELQVSTLAGVRALGLGIAILYSNTNRFRPVVSAMTPVVREIQYVAGALEACNCCILYNGP